MKKESNAVERELNAMVLISHDTPRQKLRDVIDSRTIKTFRIGRRCVGSQMAWLGIERVEVPQYKETRFILDFDDGLSLNVSRPVFMHLRGRHDVEYFSHYD